MTIDKVNQITRREAARLIGAGIAGAVLPIGAARAQTKSESSTILKRAIPASGEKLPVIGLGTWSVCDVDLSPEKQASLGEVLSLLFKHGCEVCDCFLMY